MSADTLARGYSDFLAYLAEPAVRSLLIGGVAAVALWAFRVKRVGTRLLAWTAVLSAALAMPLLGAFLPRVPLAVPAAPLVKSLQTSFERGAVRAVRQDVAASKAVVNSAATTMNAGATYVEPRHATNFAVAGGALDKALSKTLRKTIGKTSRKMLGVDVGYGAVGAPVDFSAKAAAQPAVPATQEFTISDSSAPVATRSFAIPWTAILLGIYLLGAALLLARLLIGVWFSAKLARAAQNIDDREALRLLRFRACIAGLATAPQLKESAALAVPATVGVRRSVILLPANWRAWSEEQLDAILAHEISHVARRDALVQMLSLVHRAIFWFSPLGWWLDKQLTDLAEQASDEAALAGGADRARYAETLLGFFAQLGAAPGRVWWQGVSMAKPAKRGSAERRVDRILAWRAGMSMKKSFALAVIALAAPVIFFAASVHPFIAHAQDKPPVPPTPSQNVIAPGGPVAPALPNAPKGGVKGGVVTPAQLAAPATPAPQAVPLIPAGPKGGVPAPAPMGATPVAPFLPSVPSGGVVGRAPMAAPAISGVTARDFGASPVAPPLPNAPTGPYTLIPSQPPTAAPTPLAQIGSGSLATVAPMAGYAPSTPMASVAPNASYAPGASSATPMPAVQDAEAQVRAAKEAREAAAAACQADSSSVIAAKKLFDQLQASSASVAQVRAAKQQLDALEAAANAHNSVLLAVNEELVKAQKALEDAVTAAQEVTSVSTRAFNGSYSSYSGGRYVMIGGGESVEMSGDDEDLRHARALQKKMGGDLIWFERDEKSYVITDPAFIAKAKALFAPEDALSKQQDELSRQQDALSKQQDALSDQQDNVKVKVPDISADIKRVQNELDALRRNGATQSELGRLQSELGELQSRMGGFQSEAGAAQSKLGAQQGELGRQQGELGRQQGELGRQQGEMARKASMQLRQMFDDAIAKGIAKLE